MHVHKEQNHDKAKKLFLKWHHEYLVSLKKVNTLYRLLVLADIRKNKNKKRLSSRRDPESVTAQKTGKRWYLDENLF